MAQMKARPEIKFWGEIKSRETEELASGPQILSLGSVVVQHVVPGGSGFLYEQSLVCFTFLLQHSADAALGFAQHHCVVEALQGTKWDASLVFFDFPAV